MNLDAPEFLDLARELLAQGHEVRTRMSGTSMGRSVPDGAVVCLAPVAPDDLRLGDIVLLESASGGLVCHRIYRIRRRGEELEVATWGDNASRPDRAVPATNVLGRLKSAEGVAHDPQSPHARLHARVRFIWRRLRRRLGIARSMHGG